MLVGFFLVLYTKVSFILVHCLDVIILHYYTKQMLFGEDLLLTGMVREEAMEAFLPFALILFSLILQVVWFF